MLERKHALNTVPRHSQFPELAVRPGKCEFRNCEHESFRRSFLRDDNLEKTRRHRLWERDFKHCAIHFPVAGIWENADRLHRFGGIPGQKLHRIEPVFRIESPHPSELRPGYRDRNRELETDAHDFVLPLAKDGLGHLPGVEHAVVEKPVFRIMPLTARNRFSISIKVTVTHPFLSRKRHIRSP